MHPRPRLSSTALLATLVLAAGAPAGASAAPMPVTAPTAIDLTAPTVVFTAGPAGGKVTAGSRATFAFGADEPATFACRVDAAPSTPCVPPWSTAPLKAGTHTISVRATDAARHVGKPTRTTITARRAGH
jgi:hypothetical protein